MNTNKVIERYAKELVTQYPLLKGIENKFESAASILIKAFASGKKLLVCGNGGSAADADHIVGELMKGFVSKRPLSEETKKKIAAACAADGCSAAYINENLQHGYPAISLGAHTALNTAFANDVDASLIYAQQTAAYGTLGDVFIGITTSGNSANVVQAALVAKALGLTVIGLTGKGGGKLAHICDILLDANEAETYKVQELHLPIYHRLCLAAEEVLQ